MSAPGAQGQGPPHQAGPPYAPQTAALGGVPDIIPDIPPCAVFLVLYALLFATHVTTLKRNKARGHKFLFSGALFAFSAIRVITMSLRISWALHPTNVSLAISAQVFVYVGTIILYIMNWFFAQRIVRAQHPRWGWSTPYRVAHRAGLGCLLLSLCLLIVAAVQQFFTLDSKTHQIDRALQLAGQTYFAAFCFAPVALVATSLILPRKGTEKFGAGRLRINIAILVTAVCILSTGQIFRCVTSWLPPVPLRSPDGIPLPAPWYFSKTCFYIFNFTTEIIIVIAYAVVRIDLRFHIPNGSKVRGDYSTGQRESPYYVGVKGKEKSAKRISKPQTGNLSNRSNDTLHEYESSLFDDTRTLADSLRYPSSVLEVDSKTGRWKIKRHSGMTEANSIRYSNSPQPSLWSPDRETWAGDDAPPVPPLPDWPLRESQMPRGYVPVMEHRNQRSMSYSDGSNEIQSHEYGGVGTRDAITEAIAKLESNSQTNTMRRELSNANYDGRTIEDAITPIDRHPGSVLPVQMPRSYQPGSNPWPSLYFPAPVYSTSSLPRSNSNSRWLQKFSRDPSASLSRESEYLPIEKKKKNAPSVDASFATSQAEEEFARFSFEAPPRREDAEHHGRGVTE
ncbi:hypothetical protein K505DRAFT_309409 [Melanomma pulvis-pyrius CBS 109.77]|uniref:Uncharacterized protein n=1 Tax=Melanomma pulvis-pyrius CBS 109.77 TaxID=1314802 RepID=A0A6A6X5R8_9PLEO|nr:hypothetical protein K505DRAFT_309409 [Melanomma pulvis-pyrius CBS 109.77]